METLIFWWGILLVDMGVYLTPIIVRHVLRLENLKGRSFTVDANNYLYQFLALIRLPDGTPLRDSDGHVTSHLAGLMFRTTRLLYEYDMDLVFVFDGEPPSLKMAEISRRRELRDKAYEEWIKALQQGDLAAAFSKAIVTSRLTRDMIEDAKRLLDLLGIPYVQAPGEAEAQAAHMALKGDVWAASSKDYDSLLFGTPRLLRYLTITGKEYLPSKGVFRPLYPELIELSEFLARHGISHEQLVDLAIMIGTDFNEGIKGIGPKKALKLIKTYGKLENLPDEIFKLVSPNFDEIRRIFLEPKVTDDYSLEYGELKEDELYRFLCDERDFSKKRVETAVKRMKAFYSRKKQRKLGEWIT